MQALARKPVLPLVGRGKITHMFKASLAALILFPVVFFMAQLRIPRSISYPSIHLPETISVYCPSPGPTALGVSGLYCACPVVAYPHYGFPVDWTNYGQCGEEDNTRAKQLDIGLGISIELALMYFSYWLLRRRTW